MSEYPRDYPDLGSIEHLFRPRRKAPKRHFLLICSVFATMFTVGTLADTGETAAPPQRDAANCRPFANTQPICLFSNPEDLAVLPGKKVLIVSEFGDMNGVHPGALAFYDIAKHKRRLAFSGGDSKKPAEYWGTSSCTEPPGKDFSPHGIDLSKRRDGHWQLLAVQHGGRESVEFFEVTGSGEDWQLLWRGCAIAPQNAKLNAVAAGGNDEFFTTKMKSTDSSRQSEGGDPNKPTGLVYRWSKRSGFEPVPGTEGVIPNGIAAANHGKTIYVVYSGESRLKKIDVKTGAVVASATVDSADNVKWSADGKTLLAASFVGPVSSKEIARCSSGNVEICHIAFAIVELDPDTLSKVTLFENPDAPMGGGTTGLKVDSTLFIGSFAGNRILQVDLSNRTR